jgi:hypothetical protein
LGEDDAAVSIAEEAVGYHRNNDEGSALQRAITAEGSLCRPVPASATRL